MDDQNKNISQGKDNCEEAAHAAYPEPLGREHYSKLEECLHREFKDKDLLERALTHRSMQGRGDQRDYERLEFLGDAVLDLAVAQLLLDNYPEAKEGDLSKMRAALVNTNSLAEIARSLGVGPFVRLSRGELASGGADRASILADVFEALMGAIYRDSGYECAFSTVSLLFDEKLKTVKPTDPKTELQEALHAAGYDLPKYLLEYVEGPEHAPNFVSIVEVNGEVVGRGRGATKKASHQAAAAEALEKLKNASSEAPFLKNASASSKVKTEGEEG